MTVHAAFPSFLQDSKMGKCSYKNSRFRISISHLARGAAALFPVASPFACTLQGSVCHGGYPWPGNGVSRRAHLYIASDVCGSVSRN